MKILFINPPQEGFFHTMERHYPIGLLYLAEACRQKEHEVAILDCLTYKSTPYVIPQSELSSIQKEKISHNPVFDTYVHFGTTWKDIESYIAITRPNIIALSIMFSCFYDSAYALAANIKKKFPEIITIAGGAHISILYRHAMDNHYFDYVMREKIHYPCCLISFPFKKNHTISPALSLEIHCALTTQPCKVSPYIATRQLHG